MAGWFELSKSKNDQFRFSLSETGAAEQLADHRQIAQKRNLGYITSDVIGDQSANRHRLS